ncbi:MAG: NUDIX hydrolase [Chitinivibrionales bacterium]
MEFESEPKVKIWKERINSKGCSLKKFTPLKNIYKKNGELLFSLAEAEVSAPDGTRIPPYIFIRGDAVVIVPCLIEKETGKCSFLTLRQYRIAEGGIHHEFPAGMVDTDVYSPKEVAVREMYEETGFEIQESDLIPLNPGQTPLYSSPGGSDEGIFFYTCCIELPQKEISELSGKKMDADADENITLEVLSRNEIISKASSIQTLLGINLINQNKGCCL